MSNDVPNYKHGSAEDNDETKTPEIEGIPPTQEEMTDANLELLAAGSTFIPIVGGLIGAILTGIGTDRKFKRVEQLIREVGSDLKDFKTTASKESQAYVKSEDFEDLFERTAKQVAEERSEEKRMAYRNFLVNAIKHPGRSYDEQLRLLRALEEMQFDHIRVLDALKKDEIDPNILADTPMGTLHRRLPGMSEDHIVQLIRDLNRDSLTNFSSYNTNMTGRGAQTLSHNITPLGRKLLAYIISE